MKKLDNLQNSPFKVLFVTCPNIIEAENIARILINNRLAACVNIINNLKSIFTWKGNVEIQEEALLIIKTTEEKLEELEETIKKYHSYTVPEIIVIDIKAGNLDYLKWMVEVTT
jgi:periplasmic divalent cation tolerance protein